MNIYKNRPTNKNYRARKVWDFIVNKYQKEIYSLWFNPNAWFRHSDAYWGWWVVEFIDGDSDIVHPHDIK